MYLDHYNLKLAPFENSPDSRFFFAGEQHREALANVVYALRARKGVVLITGESGTGKTMLCHALKQRGQGAATIVTIRTAPETSSQLLRQFAAGLGVTMGPASDRLELLDVIETRLMEEHRRGRAVMLLIDEAHQLCPQVLDEVRLLSDIETSTVKLLQVVLLGHTDLRDTLRGPGCESLRQRVVLAPHVSALSLGETRHYLNHRLQIAAAGGEHKVEFSAEAVEEIHRGSGGVPRLINTIADNSLLIGFTCSADTIDGSIVRSVVQEMLLGDAPAAPRTPSLRLRTAA